jgi:hypothetical protein
VRKGLKMRSLMASARLLAVAALLALAGPAGARASWSPPFDVSAPAAGANARIAASGAGGAVVVWEGDGGATVVARARRIAPGGPLGPALDVSDPAVFGTQPDVGLDAHGTALVVWEEPGVGGTAVVRARRISAAGSVGSAFGVSPAGEDGRAPRVAVDTAGNATVAWVRSNSGFSYTIRARRIDAGGALSPAVDLSDDEASPGGYGVAAGPLGSAYAVWVRQGVVQGRGIGAGGVPGPVEDLSGDQAERPAVALDAAGTATVVWQLAGGTVQLRRRDPGGALRAVVDVAGPDAVLPQLAVDPAGTATVVWLRWDGAVQRSELRRVDAADAAGRTTELWSGGSDEAARLAVDGQGNATVVWLNIDDGGNPTVRARGVSAGGAVGPLRDLSPPGEPELLDPAVASDAAGNVAAAWTRYEDPDYLIAGARLPAPAPAFPAPRAGSTAPLVCPRVTVKRLAALRPGRRPARRKRVKGVAARLRLSGAARLKLLSATLSFRLDGRRRRVTLERGRVTGSGATRAIRFRLPERLAAKLRPGQRVTLVVRLRARAARAGCPLGRTKALRLRTKVLWIAAGPKTRRR